LWPNGHPVVRLATGQDLDVVALANDRISKGAPLLADVYADTVAGPPVDQALFRKRLAARQMRMFGSTPNTLLRMCESAPFGGPAEYQVRTLVK
jgi:Family of unknown function (DUF6278)